MKTAWKIWFILVILVFGTFFALSAKINAEASSAAAEGPVFHVSEPVTPVLSTAVRDLPPSSHEAMLNREVNMTWLGEGLGVEGASIGLDPLVSRSANDGFTPTPLVTFEGIPSLSGVTPPDTNGDVGPNHYVQMTNFSFRIWDKGDPDNGIPPTPLIPATLIGDLFTPLGGQCTSEFGDPIVLYDDMADRWLLSQFGLSGPLGMCIAISQTPDPTGAYFLYFMPTPDFPDYPKIGVWPDAYYMGTNTGFPNQYFAIAFDRVSMLAGLPATVQSFGSQANLMMPADVDGPMPPPVGDPGIFYTFYHPDGTGHPAGPERLAIYEFDVDWVTPGNSTFTLAEELPLAPFNYTICGFFAGGCIAQPGTGRLLDDIAWWPMFRFQYRNFGSYEAMVGNFTVDADGANHAGIRWFEVRKSGGTYSLYQEGTHFPTTDSRWMGSIAMDGSGNIALGYSVSSSSVVPSIRYATRLRTDPLGTLSAEAEMWTGGGVQTDIHRWGDYSDLVVDPVDNCTFWYTTEYHDTNDSGFNWNTRVGVFRIPECSGSLGPDFSISLDPNALEICSPASASVDVNFNWLDGYSAPVTLSAIGVPAGYNASFSPNPVITPTVTSVLDLTNVGSATPGAYDVDIVGIGSPTPTHTATLQLNLYDAAPGAPTLVSPADGEINVSLAVAFAWNAATQGSVYDLDVATDSGFTNIVYSVTDVAATQHTMTTALDPLATYYWRVRSNNACGTGSYSSTFSFTTRDIPPILLVDDDNNGPDVRAYYTDALDAIGAQYDVWDTGGTDNEPTITDLAPYDAVIWFTGVSFGGSAGPGAASETALGSWLDGGDHCLFISSQDYLWDRGFTPFMDDYLGAASATSDVGQTTVTGVGTVFSGLGPYSLSYPFTNFSDIINPDGPPAELAFSGNAGNAAVDKATSVYQTTWWGFPFEAIPTVTDREDAMQTVVVWCGALGSVGTLEGTVTDIDSGLGIEGATVTAVGPVTLSRITDANGDYSITMPIGTYDVTASAENYVPVTVNNIDIITDTTTTQDFQLQGSSLTFSPPFIEESMEIGDIVTNTVTVTNTGPLPIDWSVDIGNYGGPFQVQQVVPAYVPPTSANNTAHSLQQSVTEKTNNISGVQTVTSNAPDWAVLLDQQPNQVNGLFSDSDCGFCTTGAQSIAENFSLATSETIGQIIFWTGYFPGDVPIDPDLITVIFHEDSGGFPGAVISTESNVPYDRVQTGVVLFGVHEWMHTLTLDTPVTLGPGNYWVEIFNETIGSSENFFWETGNADTIGNGLAGSAWSTSVPGSSWNFDGLTELAIQLVTGSGGLQWASAVPDSGTIPANSTATFDVVFDARSLYQVGDYTAELTFDGTFVNVVPSMPLTMHLSCPTCGFLDGNITDAWTNNPLEADIHVMGPGGFDVNLTGDNYALAVPAGDYEFTVSADGYFSQTTTVTAVSGVTITTDFALVPQVALLDYTPPSIERTVVYSGVVTTTVTVTNNGTIPLNFDVNFRNWGGPITTSVELQVVRPTINLSPERRALTGAGSSIEAAALLDSPVKLGPVLETPGDVLFSAPFGGGFGAPLGITMSPDGDIWVADLFSGQTEQFDADLNFVTSFPHPTGFATTAGITYDGQNDTLWWINADTFTLVEGNTSGVPTGNTIALPSIGLPAGVSYDPDTDLFYYIDIVGDDIYAVDRSGTVASGYPVPQTGYDTGAGLFGNGLDAVGGLFDVLVGLISDGQVTRSVGTDQAGVNLGLETPLTAVPDTFINDVVHSRLVPNEIIYVVGNATSTIFAVEPVDLGIVVGGGGWAYALPDTGTVPPNSVSTFDVVFDARLVDQVGTYTADLRFTGNFVNTVLDMPLTMHVVNPEYSVLMSGDMTASGEPGEMVMYTVTITNDGNVEDTFSLAVAGHSWTTTLSQNSITLGVGESETVMVHVTIPASAADGDDDTTTVTATSVNDAAATASADITTTAVIPTYSLYLPIILKP